MRDCLVLTVKCFAEANARRAIRRLIVRWNRVVSVRLIEFDGGVLLITCFQDDAFEAPPGSLFFHLR